MDAQEKLEQLEEFKSTIINRCNYDNYHQLYSLCSELESDCNLYLTDRLGEENFVCDEMEDYFIKENSDSIERLRYFINDTYDDGIYKLDGYGNLANVDDSDFERICDDLIDMVKEYYDEDEEDYEEVM